MTPVPPTISPAIFSPIAAHVPTVVPPAVVPPAVVNPPIVNAPPASNNNTGGQHSYAAINVSPLEMKFEDVGDYMIEKAKKESPELVQESKQRQTLNQKMSKMEEMIRGQDMGYSINFEDIEGDEPNIKFRTSVRDLELAEKKRNKLLVDSLARFMNTANLM